MIRNSPSKRYLQFLLCQPRGSSNEDVADICQREGIFFLGMWYLNRLRQDLNLPKVFRPNDIHHKPSRDWLFENRLERLFRPDKAVKEAKLILNQARLKEYVETMILAHAPSTKIVQALSRRGVRVSYKGIDAFRFYYWDVDSLSTTEMRALLQFENERLAQHPDEEVRAQGASIKRAFYTDPRKTAADLPFAPIAAAAAQLRLGVMPSTDSVAYALKVARMLAAIRAVEAAHNNGPNDSMRFSDYTAGVERLTNCLEHMTNADQELAEELSAIALKNDTARVPTIHELSAGNHTVDMSEVPKDDDLFEGDATLDEEILNMEKEDG